jgi:ribosome-binding protein aMBF1 (putative translation factor)
MSTKSLIKDYGDVQKAFDEVVEFSNVDDKIELESKMLMAQFLAIIQEEADRRQLKRKELAEMIGTSASYITQLFRGHKLMNLVTIAKFQSALGLKFEITDVSGIKSADVE